MDKIIEKKKTLLEKERYKRILSQEKEELKECSFKPKLLNKENLPKRSVDDLFKWQKDRQMKIMEKYEDEKNKENTFKPQISKNSLRLLKQNEISDTQSKKVEERLLSYLKKKSNKRDADNHSSNSMSRGLSRNTSRKSFYVSGNNNGKTALSFKDNGNKHKNKKKRDYLKGKNRKDKKIFYHEETETGGVAIRMIPRSKSQSHLDMKNRTNITKSSDFSISKEQDEIILKNNSALMIHSSCKKHKLTVNDNSIKFTSSNKVNSVNKKGNFTASEDDLLFNNQNLQFNDILKSKYDDNNKDYVPDSNEIDGVNKFMMMNMNSRKASTHGIVFVSNLY